MKKTKYRSAETGQDVTPQTLAAQLAQKVLERGPIKYRVNWFDQNEEARAFVDSCADLVRGGSGMVFGDIHAVLHDNFAYPYGRSALEAYWSKRFGPIGELRGKAQKP